MKAPTLKKNVLSRKMNLRAWGGAADPLCGHDPAKEKLFITAGDRYLGHHTEKWGGISRRRELPFTFLSAAGSYWTGF